jgi:hypothetical protein
MKSFVKMTKNLQTGHFELCIYNNSEKPDNQAIGKKEKIILA